jgi:hypothetical protein
MFKYYLLSVILLISCSKTKNSEPERIITNNDKLSQKVTIDQKTYDEVFRVANKYLYFDFYGGRLTGNHQYHDSLYALRGTIEGAYENFFVVDTFMIDDIKKVEKDSLYHVIVNFPNSVLISPIYNVYGRYELLKDTITVKNQKIFSPNIGHISRKVVFNYIEAASKRKKWSEEKLTDILNRLK